MELQGLIIKGIGGFYYVETGNGTYECRARGKFRKDGITPYAGDFVLLDAEEDMTGFIKEILPRKNYLVRPPVANIDNLFIITSLKEPTPDLRIIDKTIAVAEINDIEPVLIITKSDLFSGSSEADALKAIYDKAGIPCHVVSGITQDGIAPISGLLSGKTSAFTGNSGVGKSTLLNALFPELTLKTGEISQKLGRGRHTTREVELLKLDCGGYVADTPGFSTFDMEKYQITDKEVIVHGFREFIPFLGSCKFSSCSHTCEKGCAILQALENGEVGKTRFDSYVYMYNEVKDIKQWQINKNA